MFKHSFFTLSLFILQILSAGVIQALGAPNVLRGRTAERAKVPASNKVGGGYDEESSASPPCQNISLCPIVEQRDDSKGNAALESTLNDVGIMDEKSLKPRMTRQKDIESQRRKLPDKKGDGSEPDDEKPDSKPMRHKDKKYGNEKPEEKNAVLFDVQVTREQAH
ncbi:hypothetical protein JR316_0008785 [Psilocybe cubensis]|uniref:Secreted protein n=2 Tax=Psilocybe cubensis TaxID=181762 RepID=A0A8H8CJP0_PSICU|nr:hypothetical protein JR316_0008785 [Psilocybe cubensis]KAH9478331.1 hypothetical protein JR316_0008785 [Psilocybe cubensis]